MYYATLQMAHNASNGRPMEELYQAAWRGDAETLKELLQQDAGILDNIPDGRQTPLHISALLGHDRFTKVLLNQESRLDIKADSSGRTALHLASAEGHIHIVKRLLEVNNDLCLNGDKEGRIPLHYAAVRGRTKAVEDLIIASPDSLNSRENDQTTVFHMCVTYNHLETLKTLIKLDYATANITAGEPRPPIFTRKDCAGDTIFSLALKLKRVEVVSYLLSIPEIRKVANLKNKIGFTANNIMKQSSKDLEICELQHILTKAENEGFEIHQPHGKGEKFFMKISGWIRDWSKHEDKWLEEMRGNLSLVSTVIATITFQALINPPGGFIQQGLVSKENAATSSNEVPNNVTSSYYTLNCTMLHDNKTYCPGEAMASSPALHEFYKWYLLFVTVSFFSSLGVTLLLVSGIFPMKNKAVIWMLSIGMCISLTSLAGAYIAAMDIILPDYLLDDELIGNMQGFSFYDVWMRLFGLIVFLITLRFSIRVLKKCVKIIKYLKGWGEKNGCRRFLYVLFTIIVIFVMLVIFGVQSSIFYRFVWHVISIY